MRLSYFLPVFLGAVLLSGCASEGDKPLFQRSAEWMDQTLGNWGGAERQDAYDREVQSLFDQPYIDPLTRYLEQYREDDSRAGHLQRVLEERDLRCEEIAERYAERPLTAQSLAQYRAGYNYSCARDVEAFAQRVAEAGSGSQGVDSGSWSEDLTQKLNDCYLLTTIRNFGEAKSVCRAPAERGDLRAQYNMALISRSLHEYPEALAWARKASPRSAQALYLLGEMSAAGEGVERSAVDAAQYFRDAAEQGHAGAQFQLGRYLAEGLGIKQDRVSARTWYERAAAQGNADAQLALGLSHLRGEGGEVNRSQGHYWLLRAARQGQAQAQFQLGEIAENADAGEAGRAEALVWYELAARNGLKEGERRAARLKPDLSVEVQKQAQLNVRQMLEGGR